jgi:site-specific DNA recombinase
LTAYQEDLLSLDELRARMPELRAREQAHQAELQAIVDQSTEREVWLRLAETVTAFLTRLRSSGETMDIGERQRVVRLVVKEILVDDDKIVIRHSIPLPPNPPVGPSHETKDQFAPLTSSQSYALRSGRHKPALGQCLPALRSRSLGSSLA